MLNWNDLNEIASCVKATKALMELNLGESQGTLLVVDDLPAIVLKGGERKSTIIKRRDFVNDDCTIDDFIEIISVTNELSGRSDEASKITKAKSDFITEYQQNFHKLLQIFHETNGVYPDNLKGLTGPIVTVDGNLGILAGYEEEFEGRPRVILFIKDENTEKGYCLPEAILLKNNSVRLHDLRWGSDVEEIKILREALDNLIKG
jgi:hypothetical protein